MSHYLIKEPSGDIHLVRSLNGHEDATVLEENVVPPRIAGCERVAGKGWVVDKKVARRGSLIARHSPTEMADQLISLEARLTALEGKKA